MGNDTFGLLSLPKNVDLQSTFVLFPVDSEVACHLIGLPDLQHTPQFHISAMMILTASTVEEKLCRIRDEQKTSLNDLHHSLDLFGRYRWVDHCQVLRHRSTPLIGAEEPLPPRTSTSQRMAFAPAGLDHCFGVFRMKDDAELTIVDVPVCDLGAEFVEDLEGDAVAVG